MAVLPLINWTKMQWINVFLVINEAVLKLRHSFRPPGYHLVITTPAHIAAVTRSKVCVSHSTAMNSPKAVQPMSTSLQHFEKSGHEEGPWKSLKKYLYEIECLQTLLKSSE